MENLLGIIFVSFILMGFGYSVYRAFRKKSNPIPPYNPFPPTDSDDYPIDSGVYGKFEVSFDTDSSFNVCYTNNPKIVIYGSKSSFCENDRFNSPGGEFSNYNNGSILYVGHDEKYLTVITDGTNYANRNSNCEYCN